MAQKKLRIGLVFGGRSGEHEVSLASATSVMANLDSDKYEVVPIGITKRRLVASGYGACQVSGGRTERRF